MVWAIRRAMLRELRFASLQARQRFLTGTSGTDTAIRRQVEFGGTTLNLVRSTGDQRAEGRLSEMPKRVMSDELDGLDATEKAGIGAALNRCRALAAKIANELRN